MKIITTEYTLDPEELKEAARRYFRVLYPELTTDKFSVFVDRTSYGDIYAKTEFITKITPTKPEMSQ
jgi:hypothetical protein